MLLEPFITSYSGGWNGGKYSATTKTGTIVVRARSLFCYWAVRELGISNRAVAGHLGLTQPAVSIAVRRGEKLAEDLNLKLIEG